MGLQLAVLGGGVRMPLVQVAEVTPVPTPAPAPVVAPQALAVLAAPYVAPFYPRKQDRN